MSEVKNLIRYWLDKDSRIIVRQWTDEECKFANPRTHIFEKYWSHYCPICGFIPVPTLTKKDAEKQQATHVLFHNGNKKHKGFIEYRDHELICFELKEEFIESLGVWVHKQEYY